MLYILNHITIFVIYTSIKQYEFLNKTLALKYQLSNK